MKKLLLSAQDVKEYLAQKYQAIVKEVIFGLEHGIGYGWQVTLSEQGHAPSKEMTLFLNGKDETFHFEDFLDYGKGDIITFNFELCGDNNNQELSLKEDG